MNSKNLPEVKDLIARLVVEKRASEAIQSKILALNRSDLCANKKAQHLKKESDGVAVLRTLAQNMGDRNRVFADAAAQFALLADLCKQTENAIQKLI